MRRIFTLAVGWLLLIGLTACGNSTVSQVASSSSQTKSAVSDAVSDSSSADETKTLIVYFSAAGSTKKVANVIAKETDGNLFELEPTNPYSSEDLDWTADGSRVNLEHDDESLQSI